MSASSESERRLIRIRKLLVGPQRERVVEFAKIHRAGLLQDPRIATVSVVRAEGGKTYHFAVSVGWTEEIPLEEQLTKDDEGIPVHYHPYDPEPRKPKK